MALDLLVVAPHPDDAELGCGGTLARARAEGLSTGILELSLGEMGTKGTPEQRLAEAAEAARILGLDYRGNLRLPDGSLTDAPEQVAALAAALRQLRPAVLIAPHEADRHPDHVGAHRLCRSALHFAGLLRAPLEGQPHRVSRLFFYPGNYPVTPSLLVDISQYIDTWEASVLAHRSQFYGEAASETVSLAGVEARKALRRQWGNYLGVGYAEPLVSPLPLLTTPWY
ncbi:bacillithiol biosynthesis deacetylase BshB1 [Calidithermus roseus]|uniref:N-acetyl-alpha-D-glucosaminyl L-malate deacetylase 1 n=1 Tax=Calidithermus roseus TaxID=1644118 RepID=A0A399ENY5_9DEIN|nr:bacillithiol biosynthesis deacetylase BshB1 [Calidithermus roseus]RIH84759.1 N-acetyl-alpha-D-glucosaminyl L-malate deacetylase 1 [Calidithermus roseus]